MEYSAEFIQGEKGRLFCLARKPKFRDVKFVMVFVQPFAEEANKSRHMMSQLAEKIVSLGGMAIIYDHFGTGDSEGDSSQGNLEIWRNDLELVANKFLASVNAPLTLCAIRTGALITLGLPVNLLSKVNRLYLINPVLNGKQFIDQFFRLRMAAGLLGNGGKKITAADIREELHKYGSTEIAGYQLSEKLVDQFEIFDLKEKLNNLSNIRRPKEAPAISWIEVNSQRRESVMPASQKYIEVIREKGIEIEEVVFEDQQFWSSQEITCSNNLILYLADHIADLFGS